eukprot:TRINITY_DN19658_c0_g1_i1.p2 TRINITY_DN19658_c0_g1~~TRINITY_DN19658_c0_g1_i1.p2  ORF type:complete len:112 (-),score=53.39 TRINITY_DN19658_c0_g1_i1:109-444(-)
MIRRPPRSTQSRSSAASDVYKRQVLYTANWLYADHQARKAREAWAREYEEKVKRMTVEPRLDWTLEQIGEFDGTDPDTPILIAVRGKVYNCLLYTSPSPRDRTRSRMPSSA